MTKNRSPRWMITTAAAIGIVFGLAACGSDDTPATEENVTTATQFDTSRPAPRALTAFGRGDQQVGVNTFLWRGALEVVSFMPLASADPYGGVIITDWYSPPETPSERFKINIYVRGNELRSDGVKAVVFKQRQAGVGVWADDLVDPQTGIDLENAILSQARQIRLQSLNQ